MDADLLFREYQLSRAENGDECPLCHSGTIERVDGENRCMGECGGVTDALQTLISDAIKPTDLHILRDLILAFETHLADEARALGVEVETLCPCGGDEIKAARGLLERLDPTFSR